MSQTSSLAAAVTADVADPYTPAPDSGTPIPACPPPGMLPAPLDLTPEELAAFETMCDPLRQKTLEVKACVVSEIHGLMESRYKLGSLVKEVKDHPKVYGGLADVQLASFSGEAGKTVYAEARRLRERYTPERFREIMEAVNPETGARLSYKHLAILLRVEDNAQADKLLEHCVAASWSTKELTDHITKKLKQPGTAPRRAVRHRPKKFMGFIEQMAASGEELPDPVRGGLGGGQALVSAFAEVPPEAMSEDMVTRLTKVGAILKAMAQSAASLANDLQGYSRRAQAILRRRQAGVARATSCESEDNDQDEGGKEGDE